MLTLSYRWVAYQRLEKRSEQTNSTRTPVGRNAPPSYLALCYPMHPLLKPTLSLLTLRSVAIVRCIASIEVAVSHYNVVLFVIRAQIRRLLLRAWNSQHNSVARYMTSPPSLPQPHYHTPNLDANGTVSCSLQRSNHQRLLLEFVWACIFP